MCKRPVRERQSGCTYWLTCLSAPVESSVWIWCQRSRGFLQAKNLFIFYKEKACPHPHLRAVSGYWVWVSGRPTLLSLTAFRTRSSLHVWTNWSGLKSVRKHFPKDAAWWTQHESGRLYLTSPSIYCIVILTLMSSSQKTRASITFIAKSVHALKG